MGRELEIFHDEQCGEDRVLGRLVDERSPYSFASPIARQVKLPQSEWREFDDPDPTPVKDQNGKGACNPHAGCTGLEQARHIAGLPFVGLDPWQVYAELCNGFDQGSMIRDALSHLRDKGTGKEDSRWYGVISPRRIPSEALSSTRYKIEVGEALTTFDEIMSCVQLRRPVNFSLRAHAGFNTLDGDGVPRAARGPGNHAVSTAFGAKKAKNGRWLFKMKNSWSTRWGQDGYCWIGEEFFENQSYMEAYSIICVETATSDVDRPVEPIA